MSASDRLRELLGSPDLAWLVERLRRRLERGKPLRGRVAKTHPSPGERRALDRLVGRLPARGDRLTVSLEEIESVLRHAGLSDSLETALQVVSGPVVNRSAKREAAARRWRALVESAIARAPKGDRQSLERLAASGMLRRLTRGDPVRASDLMESAASVLAMLPAHGLPLAELAASVTGDSHALDVGQPLATLCLHAIAARLATGAPGNAQERRDAWASQGVLCDELSAAALVLNLPAAGPSFAARALVAHREAGEPYRLTTRLLLRDPPGFEPGGAQRRVFVCENPTVVAAAAHRLGERSSPLVSVEGQPKTAATLLLDLLARSGFTLCYHGDFDWPGVRIGNVLVRRHDVSPWRFSAGDYRAALPTAGGVPLEGNPVDAVWDASLREAMERGGRSIHEESVIDVLLDDLELI